MIEEHNVNKYFLVNEKERVILAQRQNDTVVKSARCVTLARRVTLAQRQNDTVYLFGTTTK